MLTKKTATITLVPLFLALGACTSLEQPCPLGSDHLANPACVSMQEAYSSATGKTTATMPEEVPRSAVSRGAATPAASNAFAALPPSPQEGMPVFAQPRVYSAWTAPWTDANGVMHGGETVYFATPGRWNYGTLKSAGSGAQLLEPLSPNDLGYNPRIVSKRKVTTAPPPLKNAKGGIATEQLDGVTQPYLQKK